MDSSTYLIIELTVRVICGAIAAAIASNKGRSGVGWFFGGFFLAILGIIIVACLGNLLEQRRKEEYVARENRRLREQLMQEQVKGEAFRQHTAARLDLHDQQLGFDTRSVPTALPGFTDPFQLPGFASQPQLTFEVSPSQVGLNQLNNQSFGPPAAGGQSPAANGLPISRSAQRPGSTADESAPAVGPRREWFYEVVGQTRGPVGDAQLVALVKSGDIHGATLVWTEDLGDWKPAAQVKALTPYLPRT